MTYTNSLATIARGVTVTIGGVKIGEIIDDGIPIPQTDTDDIEVTNQDSGDYKEYKAGRKDGGECEIKGNSVPSDDGQLALAAACVSGTTQLFEVTFPSGATVSFYGVVKTFDQTVDNQILRFSAKVKVSGAPLFATTKATLTTPFFSLNNSGAIVPAPAAGVYDYVVTFTNAVSSCQVTPTSTSGAITVNGTTVATGTASGNITLGDARSLTTAEIVVSEAGKTPAIYKLKLLRAL